MSLINRKNGGTDVMKYRSSLFDRLFDDAHFPMGLFSPEFRTDIPVDLVETDEGLEVTASVPGLTAKDLHIEIHDDMLRIWGETKTDTALDEKNFRMRERSVGRIERVLKLPSLVIADDAKATYENGVLTVFMNKAEDEKRKEIPITAG